MCHSLFVCFAEFFLWDQLCSYRDQLCSLEINFAFLGSIVLFGIKCALLGSIVCFLGYKVYVFEINGT